MENTFIVIIISLTVLVASYKLFKLASGTMNLLRINWISYIYYKGFFLTAFIGSVLIMLDLDGYPILARMLEQRERFIGWSAVMLAMITLPSATIVTNWVLMKRKPVYVFAAFTKTKLSPLTYGSDRVVRRFLYVLSAVCGTSVIYSIQKSGALSAFMSSIDSSAAYANIRGEIGWNFAGIVWFRQIFAFMLTPIISYIAYAYWKMTSKRVCLVWFMGMLILSLGIAFFTYSKSAIAMYLLGFYFLKVLIDGRIRKRVFVLLSVLILGTILVAYFFSYPNKSLIEILDIQNHNTGVISRIVLNQLLGFFLSLEIFPNMHQHVDMLQQVSMFVSIFGGDKALPYDLIVSGIINPGGVKGYATSLFLGEAWALFGWIGLILGPIAAGISIGVIWQLMFRLKKTPISVGVYAFLSYKLSISSGFMLFFYNPNVIKALAVLLITIWMAKMVSSSRGIARSESGISNRKILVG